jgi:hypothetical protein
MVCIPVSDLLPPPLDSAFGAVAESIIGGRFLDHLGRRANGFFPSSPTQEDFQDISIGIGNTNLYILYLRLHNTISIPQLIILSAAAMVNIPDLITHNPPRSSAPTRAEFYEIKPNSPASIPKGFAKITSLSLLYSSLPLPYKRGTIWSPDEKILLSKGDPLGVYLEVSFHFKRIADALIVYDICLDGELEKLALAVLIALVAIILALIIKGARIPVPMPSPPVIA